MKVLEKNISFLGLLTIVTIFPIVSVEAQEIEDPTQIKSEATNDKHTLRFHFGAGYGYFSPANARILKNAEMYDSVSYQYPYESKTKYLPVSSETSFNSPVLRYGLEYRYDNRFRFGFKANSMYTENLKNPPKTESYKPGSYGSLQNPVLLHSKQDYNVHDQSLARIAYYHPVQSWLRAGFLLQRERIETESFLTSDYYTYPTEDNIYYWPRTKMYIVMHRLEGTIPGLGIELEPLDWFQISYGLEKLNLNGKAYSGYGGGNLDIEAASRQFYLFIDLAYGNSELNGYRQTLDFEFRPFRWLLVHVGQTHENYTVSHGLVSGLNFSTDLAGTNSIGYTVDPVISLQKFNGRRGETYLDLEFVIPF